MSPIDTLKRQRGELRSITTNAWRLAKAIEQGDKDGLDAIIALATRYEEKVSEVESQLFALGQFDLAY